MDNTDPSRRQVLKAATATGLAGAGLQVAIGPVSGWDQIPMSLRCIGCEVLGKVEAVTNDDSGELEWTLTETGAGVTGTVRDDSTFTFDVDGDGSEETRVVMTDLHRTSSGEVYGFDFATNGTPITRVDVKGGSATNYYPDLGSVVHATDLQTPGQSDGTVPGISSVTFYYCPTVRVCVLSETVDFDPATEMDVTSDEVRLALWWGAYHHKDQYLFENGATEPGGARLIGDWDGDQTDDLCFEFDLRDAVVDDPTAIKDPGGMKASFLVREVDGDQDTFVSETSDGIVTESPTPRDDAEDCGLTWYQVDFVEGEPKTQLDADIDETYSAESRLIEYLHGNTSDPVTMRGTGTEPWHLESWIAECIEDHRITIDDNVATVEFEKVCDGDMKLSLVTYEKPTAGWNGGQQQEIIDYDSSTITVAGTGRYTLEANLPQWPY